MGSRKREQAELHNLNRLIWGAAVYDRHVEQSKAQRAARRARRRSTASIVLGLTFLSAAGVLMLFSGAAFAHDSAIGISCTQVDFNYQNFAGSSTTAHESITVDGGVPIARDFTFTGAQATDSVALSLGSGTHSVSANNSWDSSDGGGSAQAHETLSDCAPPPTSTSTTAPHPTTTTVAPTTSTTMGTTTTTTIPATTSTTSATPITPLGSTSTTAETPVTPLGSTSTTSPRGPITTSGSPTPPGQLANTGSKSNGPLAAASAMIGLGLLAMGLGRRPKITIPY